MSRHGEGYLGGPEGSLGNRAVVMTSYQPDGLAFLAVCATVAMLAGCTSSAKVGSLTTSATTLTAAPSSTAQETPPQETRPQETQAPEPTTGGTEVIDTTPGTEVPDTPVLSEDEIIDLQLACVYIGEQESCDTLVSAGFPAEGNYGLGNSLSQVPDNFIASDCANDSRLACAEISSRYSPAPGDDVLSEAFVTALLTGGSTDELAADYLADQMAEFLGTTEATSLEEANYSYFETGDFSFSLAPTTFWNCLVGQGLVRSCTFVAD